MTPPSPGNIVPVTSPHFCFSVPVTCYNLTCQLCLEELHRPTECSRLKTIEGIY